ncbi:MULTISPECIES: hypothetical protein [unclassified Oceanispirochaeta]|uniref:hypothetical protein n=1 Tax=unclassified Oceanispirochaeta TaxID=2635722 RepID=UPI000E095E58|nr:MULTISPECIES: hypothetical protein [unclassified Oceanispirochaeta]MBF9017786.1 hypothetical protein [Oceanispirochaeta sp. M2]NPD74350.1 hypothetical protein [Oceanispirochaeta sp. M1]RDG29829.1 hypothetical protein DV872_19805 [Oceanispirochaeta sp. M1]
MKQTKTYLIYLLCSLSFFACTTRPVMPPQDSDPLAVLPSTDDFYLLARPSVHPELSYELLKDILPVDSSEIYPALERTHNTVISARFGKPLEFSGMMEGEYPAFFVRRSLKKSPGWSKNEEKTYKGPDGILADTIYKNTLLAASADPRLHVLQSALMKFPEDNSVLSAEDREWWESGNAALLFYLPDLAVFPMPEGLPVVPEGSSLLISMIPADDGRYSLNGEFRFAEAGSTRFWALGLRIFLAGRLGLSESEEERLAMSELNLKIDGATIILDNWNMTAPGWGHFLSTFNAQ